MVHLVTDAAGKARCFGFVNFQTLASAAKAKASCDAGEARDSFQAYRAVVAKQSHHRVRDC